MTIISGEILSAVSIEKIYSRDNLRVITDRSNVVVLMWFSVACFCVRVSMKFHLTCVHIILVRFGLLSGHLLESSCSLGRPCVLYSF